MDNIKYRIDVYVTDDGVSHYLPEWYDTYLERWNIMSVIAFNSEDEARNFIKENPKKCNHRYVYL